MHQTARKEEAEVLPARELLSAVGQELAAAALDMDRVQETLSPALSSALLAHPAAMTGLQDLDHIRQVIGALATLVADLSDRVERGWTVDGADLIASVPLADLGRRLRGATSTA